MLVLDVDPHADFSVPDWELPLQGLGIGSALADDVAASSEGEAVGAGSVVGLLPGPAWQGFMDFLQNTICMSTTFPVSVILPINIGGTDIRRDLDIAQRAAEPMQIDLALESDEILEYLIQDEIYDGELRQGLPPDWNMRSWQFPQKINVDRGLAQQDREDVGHGLMSREEYHGRYGVDFREIEIAVIREAKARKKAIQDAGFKDTKEFVEVLSLDSKMFMTRSQDDEQLANSKTPPMKEPQNATA